MLIDTHCHIHDGSYPLDPIESIERANYAGVKKLICIGTNSDNSKEAVAFANQHPNVFATIGVHPHESINNIEKLSDILSSNDPKIVAIGEIGLDYYYDHREKSEQKRIFKEQIQLAIDYNLPVVFHVREAFDDFWPIIDSFKPGQIRGVLHSFTDNQENLDIAIEHGFYIGMNGFCTFTKNEAQIAMYLNVPLQKMLIETDAPYLTPKPFRGKVNEPAYVKNIAELIAASRGLGIDEVAKITSKNAHDLFGI